MSHNCVMDPQITIDEPPRLTALQAQLARDILNAALTELPPGATLTEATCVERLGVSRTPVRGAIQYLVSVGALKPAQRGFKPAGVGTLKRALVTLEPPADRQLLRRLVDDYLDGTLADTVFENELTERYDAGKGEVRSALLTLAEQGVISRSRGHGWTFQHLLSGPQADLESYRLRLLIEPAGLLEPTFRLDRPRLEAVLDTHRRFLDGKGNRSPEHIFELNASFHETLADLSGNRFFSQIIKQQSALRRLLEYRGYRDQTRVVESFHEHMEMIEALLAAENDRASALMQNHLNTAMALRLGTKPSVPTGRK